jgi:hypothetical protein
MSHKVPRGDGVREFRRGPFRRPRRIEVTAGYAALLAGDLDCEGYARSLVTSGRSKRIVMKSQRRGPIAQAAEEARLTGAPLSRIVRTTTPVSPEYRRFLRAEITSAEYAAAIAEYAKLERAYRAPVAPFSFRRPSFVESVFDVLRLVFSMGGALMIVAALVPVLVALGSRTIGLAMQSAWTMSFIGGFLLTVTLLATFSSILLGWMHLAQRPYERRWEQS